jgi:hypothetical protein
MSLISPTLLKRGVSSLIANATVLCAVDSSSGDLYLFDLKSSSWQLIGGPGYQFCSDGSTIWGASPSQTAVLQYAGPTAPWALAFQIPGSALISQIVAVQQILYILLTDGSLYAVESGALPQQIANVPGNKLLANDIALYAVSPGGPGSGNDAVFEYTGLTWSQVITAPAGIVLTSFIAGGSMVAAIDFNLNVYVYDSATDSALDAAIPACAPGASYALTSKPLLLIASVDGNAYYNDPNNIQNWIQYLEGQQITTLVGAGVVPLGLASDGTAYLLAETNIQLPAVGYVQPKRPRRSAVALSSPSNYNQWMTGLRQQIPAMGNASLAQLCIPGSHDSGCYNFETALLVGVILQTPAALATTQILPVKNQLSSGARFFDLRAQWSVLRQDYYIYHGAVPSAVLFSDVLRSLRTFSLSNPGEILFIYLNKLEDLGIGSDLNSFLTTVTQAFGTRLIAPANLQSSYDSLMQARTNVALFADPPNIPSGFSNQVISRRQVTNINSWANTSSLPDLVTFIKTNLQDISALPSQGGLSMTQCQLTPLSSWIDVLAILSPLAVALVENPIALAADSKTQVQALLTQNATAQSSLDLFIVDNYDTSWTDVAFSINLARL